MLIKGKSVVVYDIEIFPNFFSLTLYHTENKKSATLQISEKSFDLAIIIKCFQDNNIIWCGYNNKHYDDVIVNYIFDRYNNWMSTGADYKIICKELKDLSDIIVNSDNIESWKKWKYGKNFKSFDLLTMLFSQKLRVGLKEMEITMQVENVDEYEGDFNKDLPVDKIDRLIEYNLHDVMNTNELLERCKKDIDLRLGIEEEYGVDVLSMDGVSIGKEILKVKYLQNTGKTWEDIKDLRTPCDMVKLSNVILPVIEYKTPILQNLLVEMKTLTVSPGIDGWNKQFLFYGTVISIGVGGLHSVNEPEIIKPAEDEVLIDADAALMQWRRINSLN